MCVQSPNQKGVYHISTACGTCSVSMSICWFWISRNLSERGLNWSRKEIFFGIKQKTQRKQKTTKRTTTSDIPKKMHTAAGKKTENWSVSCYINISSECGFKCVSISFQTSLFWFEEVCSSPYFFPVFFSEIPPPGFPRRKKMVAMGRSRRRCGPGNFPVGSMNETKLHVRDQLT